MYFKYSLILFLNRNLLKSNLGSTVNSGARECKIVDVIGEKGTIIIVNTTNIHRGNIIAEGERKMLTQYYL